MSDAIEFDVLHLVGRAGLQNDHKDIMKRIEAKLHELHARTSSESEASMEVNGEHHAVDRPAFAHIDDVDSGSPAAAAVTDSHIHLASSSS